MSVRLMSAVFEHPMPDLSIEKDGARKTIKASTVKLVLLALADCANDDGKGAYPSIDTLAKKTAIRSRTTLVDCLDALQEAGYISYAGRSEYNTANYSLHMGALNSPASGLSPKAESPASAHAKVQPVEKKSPATVLKPSVNPSDKPSVKDGGEAAPPEPEYVDVWEGEFNPPGIKRKPPQPETKPMQIALATVMGYDLNISSNFGKVGRLARDLVRAKYTPEQITRIYGPGGVWYQSDWRGKKGELPNMATVAETIGKLSGLTAKNTNIKYNAEEAKRKALEAMGAG